MAILLDTSGSMEGLIEQAKSQLWDIVNELHLSSKRQAPETQSLFMVRKQQNIVLGGIHSAVSPFSTDLDSISSALFSLRTDGEKSIVDWPSKPLFRVLIGVIATRISS